MTEISWKDNKNAPNKGFSTYQKIILFSVILVIVYQIVLMLLFYYWNNDMLWKAALIFSGGISAGGYALATKSLWQIEKYEKQFAKAVWEKYGVNIFNPDEKNIMSYYFANRKDIDSMIEKVDGDKLKVYMNDTVTHINNYTPAPPKEDWEADFNKTLNVDFSEDQA